MVYKHGKDEVLALEHPLLWWKVCDFSQYFTLCYLLFLLQAHQHEFHIVACMAHNFLPIPGVMVSVKCLFLKSWHLCTDQHLSLKAVTLTQATCTKEWLWEALMKWNWDPSWGSNTLLLLFDYFLYFHIYKLFIIDLNLLFTVYV